MRDRLRAGAAGLRLGALLLVAAGALVQAPCVRGAAARGNSAALRLAQGFNPYPVPLREPAPRPLSAVAQLGAKLFRDARLSGSGRLFCASCHSPARGYGPPNTGPVMLGGPRLNAPGVRAVPSLRYLYRQPAFSIGPDSAGDNDQVIAPAQQAVHAAGHVRVRKTAAAPQSAAANLVPQGGLFWDGRADTLQQQINGPLYNPLEMAAGSPARVLDRLRTAPYAKDFVRLFGRGVFENPRLAAAEALFAIARYEIENPDFHPFTSKFDAWLAGRARFTPAQLRGYRLFNDPDRGNCAACHLDKPTRDGLPPLFTDFQYEALGAPRNPAIPVNRDPRYYDLGLCGPYRADLSRETQYCGMFLTPSLRNVATRHVFFHNGVFHSLEQVLDFYVNRDLRPGRFYSRDASGRVVRYDDLPLRYRGNVDKVDAPFNRRPGDPPALTRAQIRDVIAFLDTLTDGYRTAGRGRSRMVHSGFSPPSRHQ
ncbi:MAG TPA: cytochrome c peroxidase [Steroidobacteraceae bacterium]|nr:cytochrome c peroxidase [Steroidobacteraceae bacterium]